MEEWKKETAQSYPCDLPEANGGARRSYPCDLPEDGESGKHPFAAKEGAQNAGEARQGKGRRGGNAAASVVVRSGKTQAHPDYSKDRYQWKAEREAAEKRHRDFGGTREDRPFHDRNRFQEKRFGGDHLFDREKRFDGERPFGREKRFDGGRPSRGERRFDGEKPYGREKRFNGEGSSRGERRFDGEHSYSREKRFDREERPRWDRGFGYDRSGAGRIDARAAQDMAKPRRLQVVENSQIGSFLALEDGKRVLLPFAEQIGRPAEGEMVQVYLYEDKGGRLTATMRSPILKVGELGILKVAEVSRIGLFLDNGVPKQLLVPFREQICTPKVGANVLVYVYTDKTGRQAATMRVYQHLDSHSPYGADAHVKGFVYEINPDMGVFVAVDERYFGLIPKAEMLRPFHYGEEIEARVLRVREDGKLDLSVREKSYLSIAQDAEAVLYELKRNGGKLGYADKADAAFIEETYAMSKNQFKRAIGHLYKEKKIQIDREQDSIQLCETDEEA